MRSPSTRSNLESSLAALCQHRLSSLSDVRDRLHELALRQDAECAEFDAEMKALLDQSMNASANAEAVERDLSAQLERERAERVKALQLVTRFRAEGTAVMNKLKSDVRDVRAKLDIEIDRNRALTAQLSQTQAGPQKVQKLLLLLDEQDRLIEELQQKKRELEKKVLKLSDERDRFLETSIDNRQYTGAMEAFRQFEMGDRDLSKAELADLIRLLTKKLRLEQASRLKVEEQATQIAAAHEQAMRNAKRPSIDETKRPGPSRSDVLQVPRLTAVSTKAHDRTAPVEPLATLEQQLSSVSAEFHASLKQWQLAIDDTEFLPE